MAEVTGQISRAPEISNVAVDFIDITDAIGKCARENNISFEAPKTHLTLYFGRHAIPSDAEVLEEHLQTADIFLPELMGTDEETIKILQRVADGELQPDAAHVPVNDYGYFKSLVRSLHTKSTKSKTVIGNVDLPADHPAAIALNSEVDNWNNFNDELRQKKLSVEESEKLLMSILGRFVAAQKIRETDIKRSVAPEVARLLKLRPELLEKSSLNVLVSLGNSHSPFVREHRPSISRHRQNKQTVYSYSEEIGRRIKSDLPVSETLLKHAVIAECIYHLRFAWYIKSKNPSAFNWFVRYLVEKVMDERFITNMYKEYVREPIYASTMLAKLFGRHWLPDTAEQIERFYEKHALSR